MQRATRIYVCVIAVSKSHELLLKVRRLSSTTTPTPSRRNFIFPRRRKGFDFDFDDESIFFPRRRTLNHNPLRLRNDLYCVEWGVKLYSLTHFARA